MSSDRATAAALVDWINSCPIEPKISSLAELYDGSILAKVLLDIDPYEFSSSATTSGASSGPSQTWATNYTRLKRLHKALVTYYTETLGHRLPTGAPSLLAIAKDKNVDETIKLLNIVVAAAIHSERKEFYIEQIQQLPQSSQKEIMQILSEMLELDENEEDAGSSREGATKDDADQFRIEEEMGRMFADMEAAEARNKALERQSRILQEELDDSQSQIVALQEQLSNGMGDKSGGRGDTVLRLQNDQLQSDVQKLEDFVAEKEGIISAHELKISALKRQVEDLIPKAEAGLKYKDELDEARHTIEGQRKQLNVVEKYRKKLESMGDIERQNKTLERQNIQLTQDLRAAEEGSKQVVGYKRTIEQYKKQIEQLESSHASAVQGRHLLEVEKDKLREKAEGAESQKSKDMERIQTLEEKIRELENGVISKASDETNGDLGSELDYTTKTKTDLKLEIARLENEIAQSKKFGASADNVVLQHMLDDATKAKDKLEQDFLHANSERVVLEAQLNAVLSGNVSEGSEVMLQLRQSLSDADKQLSDLKRKEKETLAELDAAKKKLVSAETDLELVDQDKLTALSVLKATANSELVELQSIHEDLQHKNSDLEFELEQKKGLLNTVLLEKDQLFQKLSVQKDTLLEKEQTLSELKATIAAFEGTGEGRDATLEKHLAVLQKKLEDRRERMTKSKEHIKKQNAIIKDLKEQLDSAASAEADDRVKAAEDKIERLEQDIAQLARENAVLATAWHDQGSRLQMNSVTLLRRNDTGTSWINKQRSAVYAGVKK